jgi:hypothetical protein
MGCLVVGLWLWLVFTQQLSPEWAIVTGLGLFALDLLFGNEPPSYWSDEAKKLHRNRKNDP